MLKLLVLLSITAYCRAGAYPGLGLSNSYGGGFLASGLGFNGRLDTIGGQFNGLLKSGSAIYSSGSTAPTAIQSHRSVEVKPLSSSHDEPQQHIIDVPPDESPVTIHFRTHSNHVVVQQTRTPGVVPEVEKTSSEDEPHRLVHEVVKPVIQEVREIIQPYRRVVQQIQPVVEEIHTIVAKGEPRSNRGISSSRASSLSNSLYNDLPQGKTFSANGIPVYRSLYRGPAYTGREDD